MEMLNFEKGKIIVTDPCYNTDIWCLRTLNVKKGNYIMETEISDEGDWGKRPSQIQINHIDYMDVEPTKYDGVIGVDSGQAGMFDYEYYEKYHKKDFVDEDEEDNKWYKRVCNITLNEPCYGIIDNMGCVSESGFGDGMYEVFIAKNEDDEIVAVKIVFIDNEEYDDEDEWFDDDEDYEEVEM